jgi:hypothetical protein
MLGLEQRVCEKVRRRKRKQVQRTNPWRGRPIVDGAHKRPLHEAVAASSLVRIVARAAGGHITQQQPQQPQQQRVVVVIVVVVLDGCVRATNNACAQHAAMHAGLPTVGGCGVWKKPPRDSKRHSRTHFLLQKNYNRTPTQKPTAFTPP